MTKLVKVRQLGKCIIVISNGVLSDADVGSISRHLLPPWGSASLPGLSYTSVSALLLHAFLLSSQLVQISQALCSHHTPKNFHLLRYSNFINTLLDFILFESSSLVAASAQLIRSILLWRHLSGAASLIYGVSATLPFHVKAQTKHNTLALSIWYLSLHSYFSEHVLKRYLRMSNSWFYLSITSHIRWHPAFQMAKLFYLLQSLSGNC